MFTLAEMTRALAETTRAAEPFVSPGRLAVTHEPLRERLGLEAEVRRLSRERSLARFENQLLNEIVQRDNAASAAEALLRLLVPQPSLSFAALVDVSQAPAQLIAFRGLSVSKAEPWEVAREILEQLRVDPWLVARGDAGGPVILPSLVASARRKTEDVWLIGIRDGLELAAVLVTNTLWPAAVPCDEQLELLSRVGRTLARLLVRDREQKRYRDDLQAARKMLSLRTIADRAIDRPLETLSRFATCLREAVAMDRASIYLRSRRTDDVSDPVVCNGLPVPSFVEPTWRRHESKLAWSAMTHQRGSSFDASRLRPLGIDTLIGSAAAWPLIHEQRLLGAIVLTRPSNDSMADGHCHLVGWSAELLADTLRRVFDAAAIRRQARHDGLTDLTNRRTFDTLLAGEVDRVRLGISSECSLLLADLDRFKSINDTHGHPAGDEVLRVVAQLLREHVGRMRAGERSVLARYGGEELAVLLPGVGLAGALRLAEEIRLAVEQRVIPFQNKSLGVTISIGVASCPRHAMTPADIIAAADQSLYRAKSEGRNRVCQAGDS
jgi:diguanylate cyclase (GGDEF)-like protein